MTFRLVYFDATLGGHRGVPAPQVRVKLGGFGQVYLRADNNGYVTLDRCPAPGSTYTVIGMSDHDLVGVTGEQQLVFLVAHVGSEGCNRSTQLAATDVPQATVYAELWRTITASRALLGTTYARPKIGVWMNGTTTAYFPQRDSIYIAPPFTTGSDAVWATSHEYGHALHEKGLGGLAGLVCSTRSITNGHKVITCALNEGFAVFHSFATRTTAVSSYDQAHNGAYWGVGDTNDGAMVAGPIASFLLDLIDGTGSDRVGARTFSDQVTLSGPYLAKLIRTCEIFSSSRYWHRANGIDHWIYCVERGVRVQEEYCDPKYGCSYRVTQVTDASVRAKYFPFRVAQNDIPYYWRDGHTGTDGGQFYNYAVRRAWLCNLYGECDGGPEVYFDTRQTPDEPPYAP
jgi:hypothetical protein